MAIALTDTEPVTLPEPESVKSPPAVPTELRPDIDRIIRSGQQAETAPGSAWPVFSMSLATGVLLWLSFTPLDFAPLAWIALFWSRFMPPDFAPLNFAPLAWIALVPLCLLLRVERLPKRAYLAVGFGAFIWAIATLQWMRLGHVTMYGALVALAFYVSLYFPAFVAISRKVIKAGCPMWLAVPLVWTALEFVRAYLLTGFSWYYLAHSQYRWTTLVQISDVTGAYGVSFLIAMASGVIAACLPAGLLVRLRLAPSVDTTSSSSSRGQRVAVACVIAAVAGSCFYGMNRIQPVDSAGDGPVVSVVQGNFTPELKHDPTKSTKMWLDHNLLSRLASQHRPDLIVWPETMFPEHDVVIADDVTDDDLTGNLTMPGRASNSALAQDIIARWRSQRARDLLKNISQETGTAMLIGLITEVIEKDKRSVYNSAAFVRPDLGYMGRYDKIHRVLFGEYLPFKETLPWLVRLTPFPPDYGIAAGSQPKAFDYAKASFAPIICFEDTVPQLVRRVVNTEGESGAMPDVLINMTNDAWFRGSSELDQHLITATFRCIETRRPMVRAVNAGVSAFIDSSGRIRQPETFLVVPEADDGAFDKPVQVESLINPETGRRYRQCSAVMTAQVPLDGRSTVYLKYGDWFAILCSLLVLVGIAVGMRKPSVANAHANS
ncbi:apolipoprotein N-acyltransferase [Fuerstiella marisgermanici]|uniref:Apolipoprotein N-acyltransferase n=1 Tax=Fuerstiella marisgermanici TaxID=1891926 RepID=A0A1P8WAV2_9PLAN|nr:apolipoprotein N-acyltransferase [Fuerstiella marisgermanici]APZ91198.1 Apolipoprotein N-acyltransferase [Fuerstiella marisgermanici]